MQAGFRSRSEKYLCKDEVNPDAAPEAARNKILKLEKGLEVLRVHTGPSVDALKSELDKGKRPKHHR